ncbi:NfeD family protein [Estrella lausannensis]|uniref:Membrane-bound serine protease n=1 Tax=Estrella lausannensis TaxID=483423 RepID=A0A0H5DRP6_9BACT|nr:NfeD family protein [Estrella lausannensis]CRX39381.1 membrane-bound serine protease [Estrella lausannensis]
MLKLDHLNPVSYYQFFLTILVSLLALINPIAAEEQALYFNIEGSLTEATVDRFIKELHTSDPQKSNLIIRINSSGGSLKDTLKLAREIYTARRNNGLRVIIFIDGTSVGPSAILPFLSDEFYIASFATWGDIPLGNEQSVPSNILRSQVQSLIPAGDKSSILRTLAGAMVEPESGQKERKVIGQGEILALGIAKEISTANELLTRYSLDKKDTEAPQGYSVSTNLDAKLVKAIRIDPEKKGRIGYLEIIDHSSMISESTWLYVKSALAFFKKNKPDFLILKLDTPGGEVFAAQKIASALQEFDTQEGIPVVAYIDNWAISAGALIAYSCRFIYTTKDGSMGAAEPVTIGEGGKMESASEKVNSALRSEFANRARFFDRNPDIAEAMVDKDIILVERDGRVLKLANEEEIKKGGLNPDTVISPKGKLLTLNAEQMVEYAVADRMLLPEKTGTITEEEKASGKWPFEKMLLSHAPFFNQLKGAEVDAYRMDIKTRFFVLLASPVVSSLLMLGLIIGFYMEMSTPGFGIPGTLALTCLFLMILSNLSLEIASWLEVIFVVGGILMIALEVATLHSGGLLGMIGALFALIGLVGIMVPGLESVDYEFDTGTLNAAGEAVVFRLMWLMGTMVVAVVMMALLGRYLTPKLAAMTRLVLTGSEQEAAKGYVAGLSSDELPLVGESGVASTTLRPSGKVEVNGKLFDALSEGSYIEKGEEIVVSRLDGSSVIVIKREEV